MITDIDTMKNYMGIVAKTDDFAISILIESIHVYLEGLLNRKIGKETIEEVYYPETISIFLKNFPVLSVTSVSKNNRTQNTPEWEHISSDEYTVHYDSGVIIMNQLCESVKVNYTYEFSPKDLELIAIELISKILMRRKSLGKSSESVGGMTVNWKNEITKEEESVISRYRFINV